MQAIEIKFVIKLTGVTLMDRMRSTQIREDLGKDWI